MRAGAAGEDSTAETGDAYRRFAKLDGVFVIGVIVFMTEPDTGTIGNTSRRTATAWPTKISDDYKMYALGVYTHCRQSLGEERSARFDKFFSDHSIDIQTGQLLGRYIAEEREQRASAAGALHRGQGRPRCTRMPRMESRRSATRMCIGSRPRSTSRVPWSSNCSAPSPPLLGTAAHAQRPPSTTERNRRRSRCRERPHGDGVTGLATLQNPLTPLRGSPRPAPGTGTSSRSSVLPSDLCTRLRLDTK